MNAWLASRAAILGLSPEWLLERDAPAGLATPGLVSANRHCRLLRANDGWVALNLARDDDWDLVPALCGGAGESWEDVMLSAASASSGEFVRRAVELQLAAARPAESSACALARPAGLRVPRRVLDMSALWAGPLCAGLLAAAGAEVMRIESVGRPDPTSQASPLLDARINGAKRRRWLDLRTPDGRAALLDAIEAADVLVTSARAAALGRLGLTPARLSGKTWVAITAHGWHSTRVGFGDDCAVAGGLLAGRVSSPSFIGDALADPLTGLEAALAVLSGRTGLIDMAMAPVAAAYAAAS